MKYCCNSVKINEWTIVLIPSDMLTILKYESQCYVCLQRIKIHICIQSISYSNNSTPGLAKALKWAADREIGFWFAGTRYWRGGRADNAEDDASVDCL